MVSIQHHSLQRQGGGWDGWGEHPSCGALMGRNKMWMLSPSFCLVLSYSTSVQTTAAPTTFFPQKNMRSKAGRQQCVCF